jgi:hypothetical protein
MQHNCVGCFKHSWRRLPHGGDGGAGINSRLMNSKQAFRVFGKNCLGNALDHVSHFSSSWPSTKLISLSDQIRRIAARLMPRLALDRIRSIDRAL